jgi:hypothetical protein
MEEKKISRQRRWQLKKVKQGLCEICGLPIYKSALCFDHYIPRAIRNRERIRAKLGFNPWRPGSRGRPPNLELRKLFLP